MSETKWTRGPWKIGQPDPRRAGNFYIFNPNGDAELGDFYVAGVQWKGDANLIGAAPDLYEALEAIVAELASIHGTFGDESNSEAHSNALRLGRAALAKANPPQSA